MGLIDADHLIATAMPVTIGELTLVQRLGAGGMAEVFKAVRRSPDGQSDELVVVKRMLPHLTANAAAQRLFRREATTGVKVVAPNVVRTFGLVEHATGPVIVLEYVDGLTVRAMARTAWGEHVSIPLPVLLRVVADAAAGLQAIHDTKDEQGRPFVHRDISPDNLIAGVDGSTRVLDFGVARPGGEGSLTRTGEIRGKLGFMPPEQVEARPLDGRCDLYALGVTLYWLLCGRRPFRHRSDLALMQSILYAAPPSLRRRAPDVPADVERLCMQLLAKRADERPASAAVVVDALLAAGAAPRDAVAAHVSAMKRAGEPTLTLRAPRRAATATRVETIAADVSGAPLEANSEWSGEDSDELDDDDDASAASTSRHAAPPQRRPRARIATLAAGAVLAALGGAGAFALSLAHRAQPTLPPVAATTPVVGATPGAAPPAPPAPAATPVEPASGAVFVPSSDEEDRALPQAVAMRTVVIERAPRSVAWSAGSSVLLRGSGAVTVPATATTLTARLEDLAGTVKVKVDDVIDWTALPRGDLSVRSLSQVAIFIGDKSFGSTPRGDITLVAGRYRVRLVHDGGSEETRTVDVGAGRSLLKVER